MKILIDGRMIKGTGIGRYIEELVKELVRQDKDNKYLLLILSKDRESVNIQADNLEIIECDISWYSVGEQRELLRVINTYRPDLVHFTNFNFPIRYKGKFVMMIHDLTLWRYRNQKSGFKRLVDPARLIIMRLMVKRGVKRAEAVFCPSDFVKSDLIDTLGVEPDKIVVTKLASFGRQDLKPEKQIDLKQFGINKPYLLYVGTVYRNKNIERLIVVLARLVIEAKLDIQLVLVGKKTIYHQKLEQVVLEAELHERVIFTDYVDDQTLLALYKQAACYVFPSLSEGFGLPILEAMDQDLPVVCSSTTSVGEVGGYAVESFDPTDLEDMYQKILAVLESPDRREELILLGRKRVKQFSWQDTAKKTLEVYHRLTPKS
ncbi:glycosyltransferase family 4 protein [Candidatus Nomurabacteria bacterium]|nr:glycosyltransferase family 4 protein [Candidatus Nomurabacteria bacterium]